jgi:hypothetical protein
MAARLHLRSAMHSEGRGLILFAGAAELSQRQREALKDGGKTIAVLNFYSCED